jgi:hypothetical protein
VDLPTEALKAGTRNPESSQWQGARILSSPEVVCRDASLSFPLP